MRRGQGQAALIDCAVHGPGSGAELFIVEGESAASSVAAVRSARHQAVLPLQGKPMNAWRLNTDAAGAQKVREHALYAQLALALGAADAAAMLKADAAAVAALRFERIVLLMDPDADGIHIGALVLLYFKRWAPAWLQSGRVLLARAPMFLLEAADGTHTECAFHPEHAQRLRAAWTASRGDAPLVRSVRGLASLAPASLSSWCVDPPTRHATVVSEADVQSVIEVFGSMG